jgi:hypothetical protein
MSQKNKAMGAKKASKAKLDDLATSPKQGKDKQKEPE